MPNQSEISFMKGTNGELLVFHFAQSCCRLLWCFLLSAHLRLHSCSHHAPLLFVLHMQSPQTVIFLFISIRDRLGFPLVSEHPSITMSRLSPVKGLQFSALPTINELGAWPSTCRRFSRQTYFTDLFL